MRKIGLSVPVYLQGFQTGLPKLWMSSTLKLDVPECDYQVVQVDATPFQQELVQEFSNKADTINSDNATTSFENNLATKLNLQEI